MSILSDLYKKNSSLFGGADQNYGIKRYSMPNDAGTYSATGGTTPTAPFYPTPTGAAPVITPPPTITPPPVVTPPAKKPLFTTTPTTTEEPFVSKLINPATGKVYTSEEYTQMMVNKAKGNQGGVQSYASGAISSPDQTIEQLNRSASGLAYARNDISTGATDPYGVASKSGIQYTPAQLSAIEKAYAGIYDPALADVFTKIDVKQKEAANALTLKNDLEKMAQENKNKMAQLAQEHKYTMAEKAAPSYSDINTAAANTEAGYVEGANPIVDGWVQRLNQSGQDINDAIPGVKNQGLRNAVMIGLNASKSKSAKMSGTLDDINTISTMLLNPKLENISGATDQYMGGIFGEAKTAKTQYNQIVGALQLAKAGQIKGQGQISDYERKVLKEASAAIDRGMNDEEFRKALIKLKGVLQTSSGLEAKVEIKDPSTGESDVQNLNTAEINKFIEDGAIIKYLE